MKMDSDMLGKDSIFCSLKFVQNAEIFFFAFHWLKSENF